MRDEQVRESVLITQLHEEIEDLGLDDDVERRGRLVENDEPRAAGERACDHDPLSLTAGELVGVAVEVRR